MPCKVTILGSGSARPTMQNSPSGQIVELCDKSFLVDCGEGVQITMQRLGVHTSRLYNIFLSPTCMATTVSAWWVCFRRWVCSTAHSRCTSIRTLIWSD